MTEILPSLVIVFIAQYYLWGYVLFLSIGFLESLFVVGLFIPGVVVLLLAGFLISQGYYNFALTAFLLILGAVLADLLNYYLGYNRIFIFKKSRVFKADYLVLAQKYFLEHGRKSVFTGKFIGPLRMMVAFLAGLFKMPLSRFLFYMFFGNVVWAVGYLALGYFFGQSWRFINKLGELSGTFVFLGIGVCILLIWFKRKKKYHISLHKKG